MTDLSALAETLRTTLGADIGVGVADPRMPAPPLWPTEEPATTRMIEKRRREFAAGRAAARDAMADLGLPAAAIPMNPDRAPHWPDGLCGSISHCASVAMAVVAQSDCFASIGADIEGDITLEADLWPNIITDEEHRWITLQPDSEHGKLAKRIFSVKEAVHKAQYPLTRHVLEFDAVTITLGANGFHALLPRQIAPNLTSISGRIFCIEELIVSICTIQPVVFDIKVKIPS